MPATFSGPTPRTSSAGLPRERSPGARLADNAAVDVAASASPRDGGRRAVCDDLTGSEATKCTAAELAAAEYSFLERAGTAALLVICLLLPTGWPQAWVAMLVEVLR